MSFCACQNFKRAGVEWVFLAFLIYGAQPETRAHAQQPTQEQATMQRLQLEIQVQELRAALTPAAKTENTFSWAMDEIMLGNKLRKLGEFDDGPERLDEAARAYRAAIGGLPCDKFITLCGGVRTSLEDVTALIKRGEK